jgi:hypothetical protein
MWPGYIKALLMEMVSVSLTFVDWKYLAWLLAHTDFI